MPNLVNSYILGVPPPPLPQFSNVCLWLDANDPMNNGTQYPNGTSMSSWSDKSMYGNTVSQASSTNQPVYELNIQNSLPAVLFTTEQVANTGQFFDSTVHSNFPTGSGARTVFSVVYTTSSSLAVPWFDFGPFFTTANEHYAQVISNNLGSENYIVNTEVNFIDATTTTLSDSVWYICDSNYPGSTNLSTSNMFVNGVSQSISQGGTATPPATSIAHVSVGKYSDVLVADNTFGGYVAEIILYNISLTPTDQNTVRSYLSAKWAI